MKIKVIKKGTNLNNERNQFQAQNVPKKRKLEEKVTENILSWVNDLREKKRILTQNSQKFLSNFS
ncbi:MAG: hypothetical protein K1X72_24870 [Pyrinomonadaceae bacterium]|nr:hypothetical protein [Pyrinomonadaceae bacterium]